VPENTKEGKYLREIILFKEAILSLINLVELKCERNTLINTHPKRIQTI